MRAAVGRALVGASVLAGAALGACQLLTDFTLTPVAESSDSLCTDGMDNNFDGLTDCQDWGCLGQLPCCDIPEVLLVDDFESGVADCEDIACTGQTCGDDPLALSCGPDRVNWHTWPCPFAKVCGGKLRVDKESCFPAGVLSRTSMGLHPGLHVEVDLAGLPEMRGYLEAALTLQDEGDLQGALDPCAQPQAIAAFVAVRQEWATDGAFRIVAVFQSREVATSDLVTVDGTPHSAGFGIDNDRRVVYEVDGVPFATASVPIPQTDQQARLALTGLTNRAAFDAVRVQAGLRCHQPRGFVTGQASIEDACVLEGDAQAPFDRDEVYHPAATLEGGRVRLYYTGCRWEAGTGDCDTLSISIGAAESPLDILSYQRLPDNPLITTDEIPGGAMSGKRNEMQVDMLPGEGVHGYVSPASGSGLLDVTGQFDKEHLTEVVRTGLPGHWDVGEICCASAVERDGTTYLYYAGRADRVEPAWRIGLAVSPDGETFTRHADNPVLREGEPGMFDGVGVNQPTVIWDPDRGLFRMWYEGRDFFGAVSIGYAVSTDGVRWKRAPMNPVLTAEEVGLVTIGGPDVILLDDGQLRMWVHGTTQDTYARRIFQLENAGTLIEQ